MSMARVYVFSMTRDIRLKWLEEVKDKTMDWEMEAYKAATRYVFGSKDFFLQIPDELKTFFDPPLLPIRKCTKWAKLPSLMGEGQIWGRVCFSPTLAIDFFPSFSKGSPEKKSASEGEELPQTYSRIRKAYSSGEMEHMGSRHGAEDEENRLKLLEGLTADELREYEAWKYVRVDYLHFRSTCRIQQVSIYQIRNCPICGECFQAFKKSDKFCSRACRDKNYRQENPYKKGSRAQYYRIYAAFHRRFEKLIEGLPEGALSETLLQNANEDATRFIKENYSNLFDEYSEKNPNFPSEWFEKIKERMAKTKKREV